MRALLRFLTTFIPFYKHVYTTIAIWNKDAYYERHMYDLQDRERNPIFNNTVCKIINIEVIIYVADIIFSFFLPQTHTINLIFF